MDKFTPSPGKPVKILNDKGEVVKTVFMNRAERRRLKVKNIPIQNAPPPDITKNETWDQRKPIKKGKKESD